ncbi:MAG: N-acetyltransferase [Rhizobiales bacterium]|nr:N-acetyltransferase [Hyphomicrobiales bacterium]
MIAIAAERPDQREAVLSVNRAAFGGEDETLIIERLSEAGLVIASLVATDGDRVIGHILFSRLNVMVDGRKPKVAALAPLAVFPEYQNRCIGSRLTEAGIAAMREAGQDAIIVLGHPAFYRRFGFDHETVAHIASPFSKHAAFMGHELTTGALKGGAGTCRYPAAFGIPEDEALQR